MLIKQDLRNGSLKGLRVTQMEILSHLLFVDDVILFGASSIQEFLVMKDIMAIFCAAYSMQINVNKTNFFTNTIPIEVLDHMDENLPYEHKELVEGFKYLGFDLKPNSYSHEDWLWLVKKI
jgi:hypothetical protein